MRVLINKIFKIEMKKKLRQNQNKKKTFGLTEQISFRIIHSVFTLTAPSREWYFRDPQPSPLAKQIIAIVFKINEVLSVCGVCVLYVDAMTGLVMESRDDDVSAIYLDDVNIKKL